MTDQFPRPNETYTMAGECLRKNHPDCLGYYDAETHFRRTMPDGTAQGGLNATGTCRNCAEGKKRRKS